MQLDKLTIKSQEALEEAQRIAHEHSHQGVDCEHLLLALLGQQDGLVLPVLKKLGGDPDTVALAMQTELSRLVKFDGAADSYLTTEHRSSISAAENEAHKLKDEYVSTEHLLLGLLAAG